MRTNDNVIYDLKKEIEGFSRNLINEQNIMKSMQVSATFYCFVYFVVLLLFYFVLFCFVLLLFLARFWLILKVEVIPPQ